MTIFGDSRLGRVGYAIVLILMFAFDFAKGPIEHMIMAMHDKAANELMAPHPVKNFDPEAGKINGKTMPLMLEGQEDAIRDIINSKTKLSRAEIEEKMRVATLKSIAKFETNHPADPEITQLANTRSFYATLFPIAVIVMTGITVVGLLWMVSSRLRDIGWPQFVLWILLAPVFLPKFIHLPLSEMAVHSISLFFYTGLFALAFVPGEDARNATPTGAARTADIVIKQRSGQFGRLGTR
jgi:Cu/Ag efflux protein CusF